MTIWTTEGHLSELALELCAAGEVVGQALETIEGHLRECPACRAEAFEWRGLFVAMAALQGVEPSPGFDEQVMERVRLPTPATAAVRAWTPRVRRRLRPALVGAAAGWVAVLGGGIAWLNSQLDLPAAVLAAQFIGRAEQILLATVIKIAAALQLSGLPEFWRTTLEAAPGPTWAGAVAAMTALCAIAVWTLYRVTEYQPSGVNQHA